LRSGFLNTNTVAHLKSKILATQTFLDGYATDVGVKGIFPVGSKVVKFHFANAKLRDKHFLLKR